jgi:hypothetical protein
LFNHYYPDNPIKIIDSIQTKQSNKNIGSFIWAIREMELDDVDDFEILDLSKNPKKVIRSIMQFKVHVILFEIQN